MCPSPPEKPYVRLHVQGAVRLFGYIRSNGIGYEAACAPLVIEKKDLRVAVFSWVLPLDIFEDRIDHRLIGYRIEPRRPQRME